MSHSDPPAGGEESSTIIKASNFDIGYHSLSFGINSSLAYLKEEFSYLEANALDLDYSYPLRTEILACILTKFQITSICNAELKEISKDF